MQGDILNSLGVIASGLGEIDLAEQYYSACLEKFQDLADPGKISRALNNLGYSYMEKGDYQASQPYLLKSLDIAQDIGAEPLSGAILDSLATLYFAMGDYVKSTRYYRDGLRLCVKLNALPLSLEILLGFAKIYSKTGKLHQAAELTCLVYHHPSVVHEIRERAGRMLRDLEQEMHVECLNSDQIEITSLDVDHAISNILYPHQVK
jgi:tetratricopeptide (TPR) repeat protein